MGQEEKWELAISLTHSAQCAVYGQLHLDTSVQRSLGNRVPCLESRGRGPYRLQTDLRVDKQLASGCFLDVWACDKKSRPAHTLGVVHIHPGL